MRNHHLKGKSLLSVPSLCKCIGKKGPQENKLISQLTPPAPPHLPQPFSPWAPVPSVFTIESQEPNRPSRLKGSWNDKDLSLLFSWFLSLSSCSPDCLTQSHAPSVEKWIRMRRHRTLKRNSWNAVSAMRLFILAVSRWDPEGLLGCQLIETREQRNLGYMYKKLPACILWAISWGSCSDVNLPWSKCVCWCQTLC